MKQSWKLTPHDVLGIKSMLNKGMKQIAIAKRFNVLHGTISKIKNGGTWVHVLPDGTIVARRRTFGEKHHSAKLTFAKVYKVKQRLAAGESYPSIAKAYKVSPNTIRYIAIGKTWKHVPNPAGMEASRS